MNKQQELQRCSISTDGSIGRCVVSFLEISGPIHSRS